MRSPFKYFNSSPKVIRLAVMMYVRYRLSLRNVEDFLSERGIDIRHEAVRLWWDRFGPMFAAEIKKRRLRMRRFCPEWRWHLDEMFVKIICLSRTWHESVTVRLTTPKYLNGLRMPQRYRLPRLGENCFDTALPNRPNRMCLFLR